MDVGRTGGVFNALRVHELLELTGHELAGVIRVKGAHHACHRLRRCVDLAVERRHETPHQLGRLRLLDHVVNEFVPRVIIDQHEGVPVAS